MSLSNPSASWEVTLPAQYDKLTWKQRAAARTQYTKLQHYECLYCGGSLYQKPPLEIREIPIDWDLFPPAFLKYPVHLQHNHETGLTEGAIHSFCNALIWNYFRR
jgi:hypothetical protein